MGEETPFRWVYDGVSPILAAVVVCAVSFPMMIPTLVLFRFVAVASSQERVEKSLAEELYGRAVADLGQVVAVREVL